MAWYNKMTGFSLVIEAQKKIVEAENGRHFYLLGLLLFFSVFQII